MKIDSMLLDGKNIAMEMLENTKNKLICVVDKIRLMSSFYFSRATERGLSLVRDMSMNMKKLFAYFKNLKTEKKIATFIALLFLFSITWILRLIMVPFLMSLLILFSPVFIFIVMPVLLFLD